MKSTAFFLGILTTLVTVGDAHAATQKNLACYEEARHPLAAPEMEQFEFLLGSFNSSIYPWDRDAGEWVSEPTVEALWEGEYILDGTAIADYWYVSDPSKTPDADRGVNTRVYNPETQEWTMTWNTWGSNPQTTILKAKMIDGALTMWQTFPEPAQKLISKFVVNTDDHWTRFTDIEIDGQRYPAIKIESYRIPCAE